MTEYPEWEAETTTVDAKELHSGGNEIFKKLRQYHEAASQRHREVMTRASRYCKKWPRKHRGLTWELCQTYGPVITDTIMAKTGVRPRLIWRIKKFFQRRSNGSR